MCGPQRGLICSSLVNHPLKRSLCVVVAVVSIAGHDVYVLWPIG